MKRGILPPSHKSIKKKFVARPGSSLEGTKNIFEMIKAAKRAKRKLQPKIKPNPEDRQGKLKLE